MSNQRSFVLLISLGVIVFYLYYEAIANKAKKNTPLSKEKLLEPILDSSHKLVTNVTKSPSRNLLQIQEEIANSFYENASKTAAVKIKNRLKREISEMEVSNWKVQVKVARLKNESMKSENETLESRENESKNTISNQILNMAVVIQGKGTKEAPEVKRAWKAVWELVRNLFGNDLEKQNIIMDGEILENEKQTNIFSMRSGKFLSSLFNRDPSKKENPPLELGSGVVSENEEFQTELMQDISFITPSSVNSEHNVIDASKISHDPDVLDDLKNRDSLIATVEHLNTTLVLDKKNRDTNHSSLANIRKDSGIAHMPFSEKEITNEFITQMWELCRNVFNEIQKTSRSLEEFSDSGSGNFLIENVNSQETLDLQSETITQVADKVNSDVSSGVWQTIWNRIRGIGFRNERKISENFETTIQSEYQGENVYQRTFLSEFLNGFGSGMLNENDFDPKNVNLPENISIRDCREFFRDFRNKTVPKKYLNETLSKHPDNVSSIIPLEILQVTNLLSNNFISREPVESEITTNSLFDKATSLILQDIHFNKDVATESNIINVKESKPISENMDNSINREDNRNLMVSTDDNSITSEVLPKIFEPQNILGNISLEQKSITERSIFENWFGSGERELKISTIDDITTSLNGEQRFFIPNFLAQGSGLQDISEMDESLPDILQDVSLSEKNQNISLGALDELQITTDSEFVHFTKGVSEMKSPTFQAGFGMLEQITEKPLNQFTNKNGDHRMFINLLENSNTTLEEIILEDDSPKRFFNKLGSGDGREITDVTDETKTEKIFSPVSLKLLEPEINSNTVTEFSNLNPITQSGSLLSIDIIRNPKRLETFDEIKPNLSPEAESHHTNSFKPSRRGARANDDFPSDFRLRFTTKIPLNLFAENAQKTSEISTVQKPEEINQRSSSDVDLQNTENLRKSNLDNLSEKSIGIHETAENLSKPATSLSINHRTQSDLSSSAATEKNIMKTGVNVIPKEKTPIQIFCRSASECNISLKERCISKEDKFVCDCPRGHVRNPENRKCEKAVSLHTSAKLPRENFHRDLQNPNSKLFRQKRKDAMETMWLLVRNNTALFNSVAEIDVVGFQQGSLVVNYNMKILNEKGEEVTKLAQKFDKDLKDVFENEHLIENAPLDIHNASVDTFVLNPCAKIELNYCHEYADCIREENTSFRCQCKDGYVDASVNKMYPGEICIANCNLRCGENGHCQLTFDGEKQCVCSGWYFGDECHISGIIIIISFAAANAAIVIVVVVLVFVYKRRRHRHCSRNLSQLQRGPSTSAQSRVISDTIALGELGSSRMSNFVSTPLPGQNTPIIKITSPSFPGSSIGYDSTFDKSRFSEGSRSDCDSTKKV